MADKDVAGFFLELASHENAKFWKSLAAEQPDRHGVVIADCSQAPQTGNAYAFFAAQLAHVIGADLVAYSVDYGNLIPEYDLKRRRKLLDSYGVTEHVRLDHTEPGEEFRSKASQLLESFTSLEDIKAFEIDGVQLGCLLLSHLSKSLFKPDIRLEDVDVETLARFLKIHAEVEQMFSAHEVRAYVSSHFTYREGIVIQYAIQHDIPVYQYLRSAGNALFKVVTPKADIRRAGDLYAAWGHDSMRPYLELDTEIVAEWSDLVFENRYNGIVRKPGWWPRRDPNVTFHELDAATITSRRRVVVIYLHAYSDANLGFTGLYDSYYDWIQDTLKIIRENDTGDVLYIFKDHPHQRRYVRRAFVAELRALIEAQPNTVYVTEPISHEWFAAFCDTAVTVRGSAGMEAVGAGLPCVTLGTGLTSGAGITIEATDRDHYAELLTGERPSPLSPAQIRRARVFFGLFNYIFVHDSPYLPPYTPRPEMFADFYRRIQTYDRASDRSWEAMRRLVDGTSPVTSMSREEVLEAIEKDLTLLRKRRDVHEQGDLDNLSRRLTLQEKSLRLLAREVRPFVKIVASLRGLASGAKKVRRVRLPLAIYRRLPRRLKAYAVTAGQDGG